MPKEIIKEAPIMPGKIPVLGHMIPFGKNPYLFMKEVREKMGEIAEFRMFHQEMVLMTGPDANEAFFRAPDEQLDQSAAYRLMTPIFGKGVVFDAPVDKKNQQLKMLMPVLRDKPMRTYASVIVKEVESMIDQWGESGEIELVEFMKELTIYTSSHCLLGKEFRHELSAEFAQIYHDLEGGVQPLAYIFPYLPLPAFRRRDRARARLVEIVTEIMEKRASKEEKPEDAFQGLIDTCYADGTKLTPHEITGMLIGTVFAGHHTSSGTAAWVLLELLKRPEHMKPVVAELDRLFGVDGQVSFQTLREIPRLENVIKEVLRLHPPLIILMRKVMQDLRFKEYTIKAGKYVCASPPVSHRIPEIFPNPEVFDPDRYLEGRSEDSIPFSWIAFGGGRHKCSGNSFALLQIKAIFSILLRRYEFELVDPPEAYQDDYTQMVVQPGAPCRVRYRRRKAISMASPVHVEKETQMEPVQGKFSIMVDLDLCQGHSTCVGEAPELFRVNEAGKVEVLSTDPAPELLQKARMAEKYCPNRVIRIQRIE